MLVRSGYRPLAGENPEDVNGLAAFVSEPSTDFTDPAARDAFGDALARVQRELGQLHPLRIGAQRVVHASTFESVNPSRPDQVIGRHVTASVDDAAAAL